MSFFPKPSRSYAAPSVGILGGGSLHGMDARNDFSGADTATLAQNLWRNADGSVCKRPGFHTLKTYNVNGDILWEETFGGQTYILYQSGSSYYIRCGNRDRSVGTALPKRQYFKNCLYIFCAGEWLILYENGKRYVLRSGGFCDISNETAWNAANTCAWTLTQTLVPVPTIRAGTTPMGKGSLVSPPNRLTPLVRESFTYSAGDKSNRRNRFCLAFHPELRGTMPSDEDGGSANLTEAQKATRRATLSASARLEVRLQSADDDGNTVYKWTVRNWAYNDNINSDAGAFWISGINNVEDLAMDGEDNIRLTYYRDTTEQKKQANEVLSCRVHTLFGVNGYKDRLFVSGHSTNTVYYSEMDEPLYFGTLCYLSVGVERDGILLLAGQDTVLTAVSEQGAYLIAGQSAEIYKEGFVLDALFAVSACLPSPAPVGDCESVVAGNELLYLTRNGVCAVAPSGILDERCIQLRSLRLGTDFEQHTADCMLFCYGDWLLISDVMHETVYLLDLQRKVQSDHAYSSHGYECYIWTGIPARSFFVSDGKLCFYSGNQSYVLKGEQESDFHDEITENDVPEKRPIPALWQTSGLEGSIARCNRFFAMALRFKGHTGVRLSYKNNRGVWEVFREYDGTFEYPDYRHIYYDQWNYGGYAPRESGMISLPFSHLRRPELRLENDVMDQPFRLAEFIVKYK